MQPTGAALNYLDRGTRTFCSECPFCLPKSQVATVIGAQVSGHEASSTCGNDSPVQSRLFALIPEQLTNACRCRRRVRRAAWQSASLSRSKELDEAFWWSFEGNIRRCTDRRRCLFRRSMRRVVRHRSDQIARSGHFRSAFASPVSRVCPARFRTITRG